jgi:hypothetical protein
MGKGLPLMLLGLAALGGCLEGRAAAQSAPMPAPPPNPAFAPAGLQAIRWDQYEVRPGGGAPVPAPPPPDIKADAPPCTDAAPTPPQEVEVKFPFKWSWGGQYRIEPNADNFPFHPVALTPDDHTNRFVSQRLRVWATVNPNDHVEGYIQMQIGGVLWGTNADFNKTFPGPRFPPPNIPGFDDRVGITLRRAWLAYSDDECGKFRFGFLDWHDSFGDTLASSDYDFNIGGVEWSKTFKEYNNLHMIAAALYLTDLPLVTDDAAPLGSHTAWLFTYDVDQPLDERTSIGGSVYYLTDAGDYSYPTFDPYKSSYDVWVGVRGKTVLMDRIPVNGFFLYNYGERTDAVGTTVFKHSGFAAKAEAGPICIGPGKLSTQVLYATGGDQTGDNTSEFRTVAQSYRDNFGAQGYWSYLHLSTPNGPDDVADLGISLQNRGLGLLTVQAKYEYPILRKLSGSSAAGWYWSDRPNPANGSKNIGGEVAQMFTYDFGGGLKLDTGAAALMTGDFYKANPVVQSPRGLYEVFGRLQLEF